MSPSLKILIIDDNASLAHTLRTMINSSEPDQHSLEIAASIADASRKLLLKKFDLVLLDLSLPDSFGLETLNRVQNLTISPIIVLAGKDAEMLSSECLNNGAQDFLSKDELTPDQINRAIHDSINRQKSIEHNSKKLRSFEQREDFMATLTHDLKNPLIGANRILDLMIDGTLGPLPEQHIKLLGDLRGSNDALIGMVCNLLEVYKYERHMPGSLHKESVNLKEVVQSYIGTAQPRLEEKNVTVTMKFECSSNIYAEPGAMHRIVQNLVENALKFTPRDGHIAIRLWHESNNLFFQIADTGSGVPKEEQSKLFQPFFQGRHGRASSTGTGLGLYLCRQLIESHNGKIWYTENEKNVGAVFTLSIPDNGKEPPESNGQN